VQVLSCAELQEAFVEPTDDSALGSPPAQPLPMLRCFHLHPSPTGCAGVEGMGAVQCVLLQFLTVILLQLLTTTSQQHRAHPAVAGMSPVSAQLAPVKAAAGILSVCFHLCHKLRTLWQWSGACRSCWM